MKKRLALLGSLIAIAATAFAGTSPDRLKNTVVVGDGVAGTKSLSFDIGGSNPIVESVSGVLKLSTNGTNLMTVPAATDTFVGKATTDIFTNKTIGAGGLPFTGSSSGSTLLQPSAAASGTLTLPAATDTLVGKATTDTLTNKTLTSPTISGPTITGDVSQSAAGSLSYSINDSATTGSSILYLKSGNGTTSANNRYIEFQDNDSSQQSWDLGHVGDNKFTLYNQTAGHNVLTVDTTDSMVYNNPASGAGTLGMTVTIGASDSGSAPLIVGANGSTVFEPLADGQIVVRPTNWGSSATQDVGVSVTTGSGRLQKFSSSKRYKHAIKDPQYDTSKIYKMRPRQFKWNTDGSDDFGFIAEEVYEVFPEAVIYMHDESGNVIYEANGKPRVEAVKYKQLVSPMIAEMKKLNARITKLEKEVEHLKTAVNQ